MAIARIKTWTAETLTAADLNAEFNNVINVLTGSDGITVTTMDATSNATVGGTFNVDGATTFDGAVTLGNATGDDIVVTGYVASDIIPKTDSAYDLGSTGLRFKDLWADDLTVTTSLTLGSNSVDAFASGTDMIFYQAAAPTGWTINSSISDRMLLNDHAAGGSTGGSWATLSTGNESSHTHSNGSYAASASSDTIRQYDNGGGFTSMQASHTHDITGTSSAGSAHSHGSITHGSTQHNWAKIIICSKD